MYDPDMARKARDDDNEYYAERAAAIDARQTVGHHDSEGTALKSHARHVEKISDVSA